ncbi:MAG: HEPN domain-containing protein [Cyclobacteriaceae bacterium]|nr:HEPN domain-containing protein [Cytophagales bacterium]MCZ8327792.1 HEPN domain-containing protein [Cyclobacteriaceae bacterium]
MEMFDEMALIAHIVKSREEYEKRGKELVPARMKIALEGFTCEVDRFEISPEFVLRKGNLEERQAFWSRTNNPMNVDYQATVNEFFAELDFDTTRNSAIGLAPREGMTIVSIFFAVCGEHIININKGNFYIKIGDEYRSAGFHTSPNEYRFFTKTHYNNKDLNQLKSLWPVFKNQYQSNLNFALVARRFFYSVVRVSVEDRLIDLMIALEALMVPERSGTKSDKLSDRLGKIISSQFDYETVSHHARKAYRQRNSIVHGGDISKVDDSLVNQISKYVKSAIQEYLIKFPGLSSKELSRILDESNT